jgi:serine/threonine protein kinase
VFERDLVQQCANRRMSNVVLGIESGEVVVPGHGDLSPVSFIIFEEASGDVRKQMDMQADFDHAWALRVLHNVANGLRQLHQANIAHQDLKPSNVLLFKDQSKIGDLGRAFQPGTTPPHADATVPGDLTYAPLELLYGQVETDAMLRCRASDAYHLGSMVAFMFTKVSITAAVATHIDPNLWYRSWGGSYTQALPHVRDAFDLALADLEAELPAVLHQDVCTGQRAV